MIDQENHQIDTDSGVASASDHRTSDVTSPDSEQRSPSERLVFWKSQINQNVKGSYYGVGLAFHEILHKERLLKPGTFAPWVRDNFGLTRSTAYEYLRAYKIVGLLQNADPDLPVPSTLSHFRVFNKCSLNDGGQEVAAVWRRVLERVPEDCQRLTAKVVLSSRGEESGSTDRPAGSHERWRRRKRRVMRDETRDEGQKATVRRSTVPKSDESGAMSMSTKSPSSEKSEDGTNGNGSPHDFNEAPYSPKWFLNIVEKFDGLHHMESPFTEEAWPDHVFCNLLRFFPSDDEFKEQGSFMEKAVEKYASKEIQSGLFVCQAVFCPTYVRLLSYPNCFLLQQLPQYELSDSEVVCLKHAAVIYIGDQVEKFVAIFSPHGSIPGVNCWSAVYSADGTLS